ncbi:MAG TPA: AAA family ATPase [Mycobacterium sp.]|nr:AAA family ATPase [Mycobacterium sp.]
MRQYIVLVSGVTGSGKSTLAKRLAPALVLPLISKDTIKEALADSLGLGDDAWSQRLGAASFEVLWALLRDVPQAVLETSWHPERAREQLKALGRPVFEIHCTCPDPILRDRIRNRLRADRHSIHRDAINPAMFDSFSTAHADGIVGAGPVLEVDTTLDPDLEQIANWINHNRVAAP